jgi:hypothetical protein
LLTNMDSHFLKPCGSAVDGDMVVPFRGLKANDFPGIGRRSLEPLRGPSGEFR